MYIPHSFKNNYHTLESVLSQMSLDTFFSLVFPVYHKVASFSIIADLHPLLSGEFELYF